MKACRSKMSATQIMSRATHIRPCLSSSAHSGVTDSQGILLTCLFNFTEPHNSCCHHTYKNRTSQSSVACESGCAFPLCRSDVSCHPSWRRLNLVAHLSADKVTRRSIYLILLQLMHTYFTAVLLPTSFGSIRPSRDSRWGVIRQMRRIYDSASLIMWVTFATSVPFLHGVISLKSLTIYHRLMDPQLIQNSAEEAMPSVIIL